MKNFLLLFFSFILPLSIAAQQQNNSTDNPETKQIRKTFQDWVEAYKKRDLAGTMAILDRKIIFSFQGAPDADYETLEKGYIKAFAGSQRSEWVPEYEEIKASGELGFVRSVWKRNKTESGVVTTVEKNRGIDIFQRQPDGSWKIIRSLNYPSKG